MSIQSEITRISGNVSDALGAVAAKGVTVPAGATSDDLADLISQIQQGGGSGVVVTETADVSGGIIKEITAVDLSGDTVDAAHLLNGYTAHDRLGNAITGTYAGSSASLQAKTNIEPSTSSQTITPDAGYDGLSSVQINGVATGEVRFSATTITANPGISVNDEGLVTGTVIARNAIPPIVTPGYIDNVGNVNVNVQGTNTLQLETTAGTTITPSSTTQIAVPAGHFTTGDVLVGAVPPSAWTLIKSQESAISTTSTSAATAVTIACGAEAFTASKIVWVHIRDKAGPRAGYFYGSDAFFINYNAGSGSTTTFSVPAVICLRYNNGAYAGTAGQYGVYGYSISSTGSLIVRRRYNSSYSLTINGTYTIDVYTLDLPSGETLFG